MGRNEQSFLCSGLSRGLGFGFLALLFVSLSSSIVTAAGRDPRQLSLFVADFDGTFAFNLGNFRLRRVSQVEAVSPFFKGVSSLPEEILVPVHDYEGNTGPQIAKRIGHLTERGLFVPSTSLDPITLSNGETIIPGFYYLDLQQSYVEFRAPRNGKDSFLLSAIEDKFANRTPFLLEAYPFLSLAMNKEYDDRVNGAILTMRGHSPEEMKKFFERLQKRFKLGNHDWPLESFVNLSHPDFFEFSFSKGKYLERLYQELTDRVMNDHSTPHFLVMFENDRKHLREVDDMFQKLSNQGVFANPVVPILVNLVEQEVLEQPDGQDWDRSPMANMTKMSRVTVYWPGKIERSNDLNRLYELTLQMEPRSVQKLTAKNRDNKFICARSLERKAFGQ